MNHETRHHVYQQDGRWVSEGQVYLPNKQLYIEQPADARDVAVNNRDVACLYGAYSLENDTRH